MPHRVQTLPRFLLIALLSTVWSATSPASASAIECLIPPVVAPVVEPFRMPPCEYCSGHRGIEFATVSGTPVLAAAAGSVTFVGTVAGTRYLVIRHRNGVRATYGGMVTASNGPETGDEVVAGSIIGAATNRLYFGLRADDSEESPIDPTPLLGRWRYRARLLPTDGRPSRLPPAPRLVCRIGSGSR